MVELTRTVRIVINPVDLDTGSANGFGGVPAMAGFGRFYELDVVCGGEPDATTGYLVNIKTIDRAVRQHAVPLLESACRESPNRDPASILPDLIGALDAPISGLVRRVRLRLSPYYSVEMGTDSLHTVLIRQKFDFAASHRLHVGSLSDEENRRLFGRCNNPNGHGHNYVVEPCVAAPIGGAFGPSQLEQLTLVGVIDRFDHKNLSVDCAEFADLNPSVEHIARVCFELLSPPVKAGGADLVGVTVWETDRTSCMYPG